MENKKIMFLVMLIIIIVLAVSASTYAFLQPGWRRFNEVGFGTITGETATFAAYSDNGININIEKQEMGKNNISDEAIATASSNVVVQIEGGTDEKGTTCTYDLLWVWDSDDQYKEPDVPLPYTHEDGTIYPYEFSVKVGTDKEKDLSSLSWKENKAIITTKTIMTSQGELNKETIPINVKIYNIPVVQNKLSNKLFRGHIEVSEARCTIGSIIAMEPTELLSDHIKSLYTVDGVNDLYYHDGLGTYTNSNLEAGDNSYRFAGANPDNYVCFGSDAEICPDDNLYRIIGVFGENVKVIKNSSIGNLPWDSAGGILWTNSSIKNYLNTTYLSTLGDNADYISNYTWSVAGTHNYQLTPKEMYDVEMNNNKQFTGKVGLMYASDYMYSASPNYWTLVGRHNDISSLNYENAKADDWVFLGETEWTISPQNNSSEYAFMVMSSGSIGIDHVKQSNRAVRPSFYLKPTVLYVSGSGTKNDPMRINNDSLAAYISSLYTADGENGLYYHDGKGTYTNSSLEAGDNSYRYAGSNPNNYVCFGDNCTSEDNIFRIIGVFGGNVKLIKSTYASRNLLGIDGDYYSGDIYYWNNQSSTNEWSSSDLNKKNLNVNYSNTIEEKWLDKIASTNWVVSGINWSLVYSSESNAKNIYDYEIAKTCTSCSYNKLSLQLSSPIKFGLIYVSDYMYGASPQYWSYLAYSNSATSDYRASLSYNWLRPSESSWTISKNGEDVNVYVIQTSGLVNSSHVSNWTYGYQSHVYPCFYLKPSVRYISGTGTYSDPYIIG